MKKSTWLIAASAVISLASAVFLYIAVFPDCLFPNASIQENVTVRSVEPIDPRLYSVLDIARSLLKQSTLYDSTVSYRFYFCEDFPLYALFSLVNFRSFGVTYPLVNRIFMAKTDISGTFCFANKPQNNRRLLHTVLAHEMTHCLLAKRFGLWRTIFAPKWKTEGYCEFIANESSFDPIAGIKLIKEGKRDRSLSFSYFKHRLYVTYLIARKGLTMEEIMKTHFDTKKLDEEIRAAADSILDAGAGQ